MTKEQAWLVWIAASAKRGLFVADREEFDEWWNLYGRDLLNAS